MTKTDQKKIVIVGGGPAGIMAAIELSKHHKVHLYEKGKTLGRKFLVAGKGGFNLSNKLKGEQLLSKYTPQDLFSPILKNFDTTDTRNWLHQLGIETYVGSSGRIFPLTGIKPIEVLNALKNKILEQNGNIHLETEMEDIDNQKIVFNKNDSHFSIDYDICILALGGASWSVTGSNGNWLDLMTKNNIKTIPFEASNCGIEIDFTSKEIRKHIGSPLKNIQVSINNTIIKGEAVVSKYGLEGNAIYPIAAIVREELKNKDKPAIQIDLKPNNTEKELLAKLTYSTKAKNYGYLFNLNKTQIALIKSFTNKETYLNPQLFVKAIKKLSIPIENLRPIEEAISTTGGVDIKELNNDLSLKKIPNIYIAGEMFDWDTITGGFLLQGCFATAYHISKNILS